MKTRLLNLWESLRTSFWFLPSLITLCGMVLAFVLTEVDKTGAFVILQGMELFYGGGAEGARAMLSTIAGSMITIAGVSFSITIVALTLASSQFGPRLLRNFMRDTGNQVVLGTFIGTFIYCLLVLQAVRGTDATAFVPKISVTFAVVLALASIGVLIYFIHHVAKSIQADSVVDATYRELDELIDRLFLNQDEETNDASLSMSDLQVEESEFHQSVTANYSGYLQAVDMESLLLFATSQDLVLHILYRPGDFVFEGSVLVQIKAEGVVRPDLQATIREAFIIGEQRTPEQDAEFAIHQLVEIAVKALSPGINDPFTAVTCVDRLGAAICKMMKRSFPQAHIFDADHQLRIVTKTLTFWSVTKTAFDQIRQYGYNSVAVTTRLLDVLIQIAKQTDDVDHCRALRHQARMIDRSCHESLPEQYDRNDVQIRYQELMGILTCK